MKGRRSFKERLLAFTLAFAMVMTMVMEPVQIKAANDEVPGQPVTLDVGDPTNPGTPTDPVGETYTVTVTPNETTAAPGGEVSFTAIVAGSVQGEISGAEVTWSSNSGSMADNTLTVPGDAADGSSITVTATYTDPADTTSTFSGNATVTVAVPKYEVSGTVKAGNGVGIPNAAVTVGSFGQVTTDGNGNYTVSNVPAGTYDINVTREGFNPGTGSVTVGSSNSTGNDIILSLASAEVSVSNDNIVVEETTGAAYNCALNVTSVTWSSSDSEVAAVDGNGTITGKKAGSATISATLSTAYGDISAAGASVTVSECGTKIVDLKCTKEGNKKIIFTAEVRSQYDNLITAGGDVEFTIKQTETKPNEDPEEDIVKKATVGNDGVVTLELTRQYIDFSGEYKVIAKYLGITDFYAASAVSDKEYGYEAKSLAFYDSADAAEAITVSKDEPLKLTYGEEKKIWVDASNAVANTVFSNLSDNVSVTEEATSEREGCTEFTVKATKVTGTDSAVVTFKQSQAEGKSYPELYIAVSKKEISIDEASAEMQYSKIYDDDRSVFEKAETSDVITLKTVPISSEDIVAGDETAVSINLTATADIAGTLPGDFDLSVTNGRESQVTFDQSQLALAGDKAENYELLKKDVTIKANVIINKRSVKVKVSDATREFGHALNNGIGNDVAYTFTPEDWLDVETGTTEGISGVIESDYTDPAYTEALLEEQTEGNAAVPGTYQGVLSVDTSKFTTIDIANYEFTIVTKGTLTVVQEKITDVEQYLDLKTLADNLTMYVKDGDSKKQVWVKANGGKLNLQPVTTKLYDTVSLIKVGHTALSAPVSLTSDGYTFERDDIAKEEDVEVTLQLKNKDGALSEEFTYTIYLDASIPEVSISDVKGEMTGADNFVNGITFGRFGKTEYSVDVKVKENDTSGLRNWTYMVLPLEEDMGNDTGEETESKLLEYIETLKDKGEYHWQAMSTSSDVTKISITRKNDTDEDFVANNYVVLVKPFDNVDNSKIYTSLGVILDNNDPYIDLDLADNQIYRDVYNDNVNLKMTITDNHAPADKTVSGLKEIYYQIAVGKENLEKAEKTSLYNVEENKTYTLDELQKEVLNRSITVSKELNSNDIWVRVTAVDNSDNSYIAEKTLKIDITKPVVTVAYETEATENYAPYYNKDRTAVITVKERNVDVNNMNELYFNLQRENEQSTSKYVLSALGAVDGLEIVSVKDSQENIIDESKYTDERTIEIRVCFKGDNKYNFDVHCKDKGDWENQEDNSTYFVIDQTAPEWSISYYTADGTIGVSENEANRYYSGKGISAKIQIKEHNFALDGQNVPIDVQVTADKVEAGKSIQDYNALEKTNSKDVWGTNGDIHTSVYSFDVDANYANGFTYTDLAGNSVTYGPGYFTVDKTKPTGTVEIKGYGFWEKLLESITFGLFSPSTVNVEMTGADHTSPIYAVQYERFHDAKTREELEAYSGWSTAGADTPGFAAVSVSPDEQFVMYTKVTDYAGNYEYFSSDGMIVDSTKPAPKVTITNLSQAQNGIFNEDVTLQIDVEDPFAGDTYSGLERVWYTVSASGNVTASETIELLNNESNKVQGSREFSKVITVPAQVYNSNDVKVQAFALDFSGNQGESEVTELKIDVTNPSISVSWDLNNGLNGRYYKDTRTATVTVTDRNFDPNNVRFTITNTDGAAANIGGWSSSSNIGISDSATSTCQVSFPADGDYTFTLGCTDLAGNSTEYGQTDEFTIDKTVPVLTVSYDNNNARNGNYFKETRTATVTIREHNFNAGEVRTAITASLEGRGISAPSISGFSGGGDVHTATVHYSTDGDYTFDVDYTDMAGNQAADYTQDTFTVDLTAPEVEITDIEDKSANNDVVSPNVKATDVNYDAKGVTVTLNGTNNGKVDIGKVVSAITNGQSMKLNDFAREEKMDDLYKLTAKAVDKAGNETEKSVLFSVNRYGSVFVLDDDTKEWLSTKDTDYTYINREKEVGVIEYNVDAIETSKITVNRDGELTNLKEKTDYTVKSSGSEVQWKENHYVMSAENFAEEGNYTVILNTQDKAKNAMNNTSVKKSNKNLPIAFTVDKTAPTVVVSGIEDGGQYRSAERTMTVDAKDNLALAQVSIDIDGTETVYEGEELRETDGVIKTAISSANSWQSISVTAKDAAGNVLGQTKENDKAAPVIMKVLVTPNVIVQYYMNKPLFFGSIIGILAIAGIIIFLIWKKRKDEEEKAQRR